jgi:energy-coupling factor transporter ATP-binding protein EcfA2
MLNELYIHNYRRFLNSTIVFEKTVLIAGKNGAGKTTVIELLNKLKYFIINPDSTGHLEKLMVRDDVPRWMVSDYGQVETHFILKMNCSGLSYVYELKIQYNLKESKCRVFSETLSVDDNLVYNFHIDNEAAVVITDDKRNFKYGVDWSHSGLSLAGRVNSRIKQFITDITTKLHVFIIAPETAAGQIDPSGLDISGGNFSGWYTKMLTQNIEVAADVLNSYKIFLPNCSRTFIDPKTGEFTIEEKNSEGGFEIRFSELSAGQKKLCVYYALFKMLPQGSTLVFDEFENHLSPAELQPLYDLVQYQQDEKDLQTILVSHHQKTLNWYHDSALLFSLSGLPAHIKIDADDDNGDRSGATLLERMEGHNNEL